MEKMWFYVKEGTDRQGPVPESELRALAEAGRVLGTDLVWADGQPDWRPMNTLPEFGGQPAASQVAHAPMVAAAAAPYAGSGAEIPPGLAGWMTFVGVMNIVGGVFTCLGGLLSILTIIIPLIYIPMGILLILSGTALTSGKEALLRAAQFDENVELFLAKLKRYMVIMGAFYIVSIVFTVLGIIALLVMILGMGMSFTDMMSQGAPGM